MAAAAEIELSAVTLGNGSPRLSAARLLLYSLPSLVSSVGALPMLLFSPRFTRTSSG
ncbi:MAG: hypothetical protein ACI841_001818, partial [Planctomycetota bacterium]